jgi:hypothetical protein
MRNPRSTSKVAVLALLLGLSSSAVCAEATRQNVQVRTLSNKLALLERLVSKSSTVARAQGEGDDVTLEILAQARQSLAQAREDFARQAYAGAEKSLNQGFKLLAEVSRSLGAPKATAQAEKRKYAGLHERVVTFTDALQRIYKEKGIDSVSEQADLQILRHGIEEAETLARSRDYGDANRTLSGMAEMVEIALTRARHQETLLHVLTFESPEEEYAYEKGRNKSYEMLMSLLRKKQEVDPAKLRLFSDIVAQNDVVRARAEEFAAAGDVQGAIDHLERGTERLAKALRALGLSF